MAALTAWAKAKVLASGKLGRKGGVLIEYLLLVSYLATSALIIAGVQDLEGSISTEFSEVATDVDGF